MLIGCGSPHGETVGAPQSKLGASALIGCDSPHGETVGVPQSERRGVPHSKSGSIGACLLSTGRRSWVHVPSVPSFLAKSGHRPSTPYLHQRPAAPYLHRTPAALFAWVALFALSAARSMPTR